MTVTPDTPLTQFPGVGEVRAKKLSHLGLNTAGDLLTYYPRDYEDRRQVYAVRQAPEGVRVCVRAMVAQRPRLSRVRKGLDLVQVPVVDQGGTLHLTFFNQSYVERALLPGEDYVFYGQVERQGNRLSMTNPVFERADRQDVTGRIVPVYPLTAGISLIESVTEKMDEVGFKDDEEWTYLTKIFGSNAIPAESAATITKAIKKAEKDGAITSKNRWQLIEMLATEYLAGK